MRWLTVPKRLRYFLERDANLQGTALHLFLRAVEQCLRAHSPGSGPAARLGAVAFIHRFGSNRCELPLNIVKQNKSKLLTTPGLDQKVRG